MSAYDYDEKIIHVGTPGIFHKLASPALAFVTRCGRDASDSRATAHRLEHYQPCVVCWPPPLGNRTGGQP